MTLIANRDGTYCNAGPRRRKRFAARHFPRPCSVQKMSARACKGKSNTAQPHLCTPCAAASQHAAAQSLRIKSLCFIELAEADRNGVSVATTASDRRSDPCRIPAPHDSAADLCRIRSHPRTKIRIARRSVNAGAARRPFPAICRSRGRTGTASPDTAQGVHNARRHPARPSPSKVALPLRSAPHNGGLRRRPPCRTVNAKTLSAGY